MSARRSRLAAVVTAVVLAVGASGLATVSAAAQANLLANPGFETGSLSGWSCSPLDSVITSPVHSGSYALAGAVSDTDDAQCTQTVSLQPSTVYTLSGWVEGDYVYIGDSGTGTSDTSNWTPAASSWTQLSTSFTTGAATTSITTVASTTAPADTVTRCSVGTLPGAVAVTPISPGATG